jgi:hypothetical protein
MNHAKTPSFVQSFMAGMASVLRVDPDPAQFPQPQENGLEKDFSSVGGYFWHSVWQQDGIVEVPSKTKNLGHVGQQLELLKP